MSITSTYVYVVPRIWYHLLIGSNNLYYICRPVNEFVYWFYDWDIICKKSILKLKKKKYIFQTCKMSIRAQLNKLNTR